MRKPLISISICLASLLFPTVMSAQLPITKEADPPTIIASASNLGDETCSIIGIMNETLPQYYLRMNTTNRYDDLMLIPMGDDLDKVVVSIKDQQALFEQKEGTTFSLPMFGGTANVKVFWDRSRFSMTKKGGQIILVITADGYAGHAVITKKHLETLLKGVDKYKKSSHAD